MSFEFIPFLFIVFVVYVSAEYARLRWHNSTGRALAECAVPFQALHENPKHRILVIGESTAVGTGAERIEDTIAGRISRAYPHTRVENLGKNGMRTAHLLERLRMLPQELAYDLMILNIGGNDAVFLSPLDDVAKDIAKVLDEAKHRAREVVLWTGGNAATIPAIPLILRYYYRRRSLRVREDFRRAAQQAGAIYIDLFRERKQDPVKKEPRRYVAKDWFHPSGAGYGLWFDELQKTLKEHGIGLA